jgi:hypothetical protein
MGFRFWWRAERWHTQSGPEARAPVESVDDFVNGPAYVGRGLNPHLGFVAGWVMFLDYLIIPIMSVVYAALSLQRLVDDFAPGFSHQLAAALGVQVNEPRVGFVLWVVLGSACLRPQKSSAASGARSGCSMPASTREVFASLPSCST